MPAREEQGSGVGQNDMFGSGPVKAELPLPQAQPWDPAERLQREYDAIGFFLTGHPLAIMRRAEAHAGSALRGIRPARCGRGGRRRIAATVVSRQERRTKSGTRMGIVGLSDPTGHFEAVIFSEGLAHYRDLLEPACRCS